MINPLTIKNRSWTANWFQTRPAPVGCKVGAAVHNTDTIADTIGDMIVCIFLYRSPFNLRQEVQMVSLKIFFY